MRRYISLILLFVCGVAHADESPRPVDYTSEIKPILQSRCYACHGVLKRRGRLRVDTAQLLRKGGRHGAAITPGHSAKSLLIRRVTAKDKSDRMPPEGKPLTTKQVALLKTWIDQGAKAPDEPTPAHPREHWAFQPIVRPKVPAVANSEWVRNPLDAFIAKQHKQHGLKPQPEAPRAILIRRLYVDLIGLPPSANEIKDFLSDTSPNAYEKVVSRLLASPHHGERWARHWMDIWRYSDWSGFNGQLRHSQKHIWHWRDWIVESLNANNPYDEMVRQMLAADELYPNDLKKLRATGYLARNYVLFNRNQWLDNVVEHVGKGFLGLTMNCAKCHDHKYDPITQPDYYAMRAFFEPYHVRLDVVPGQPNLAVDGVPRAFDGLPKEPTYLFVRGDENRPDKSKVITPDIPDLLSFTKLSIKPVSLPVEAWQPERQPWIIQTHLTTAKKKVEAAMRAVERFQKAQQRKQGDEAKAKQKVAEATLALAKAELTSLERRAAALRATWGQGRKATGYVKDAKTTVEKEKAIAAVRAEREVAVAKARKVLADAELVLAQAKGDKINTAGVNVYKAQEALTQTQKKAKQPIQANDRYALFVGAKWTPTRFRTSTRNDPTVPFVPQSTGRRTALAKWITDSRNPLTARVAANHIWTRHMGTPLVASVFDFGLNGKAPTHPELLDWLASELISSNWNMKHLHHLIVTSATYRMTSSLANAKTNLAKDPNNVRWWRRVPIRLESQVVRDSLLEHAGTLDKKLGGPSIVAKNQAASNRRSLYFAHSATDRNQFLGVFDEAMVKECYRREQSIVPQQALALTNSKLVLDASPKVAARLSRGTEDDSGFIRKAFLVLLGITASDAEISACQRALQTWRKLPNGTTDKARAHLVWALINHNDFVTLR